MPFHKWFQTNRWFYWYDEIIRTGTVTRTRTRTGTGTGTVTRTRTGTGTVTRTRTGTGTRTGTALQLILPELAKSSVTNLQRAYTVAQDDEWSLRLLGDILAERGISMHGLKVGNTILMETLTWTYLVRVSEVSELHTTFENVTKITYIHDLARLTQTGRLVESEDSFVHVGTLRLSNSWIGPCYDWKFPLPAK